MPITDEVIGDLFILIGMTILILYVMYRDERRQDIVDSRYDRIISHMIETLSKQQIDYRDNIIEEIKQFSVTMNKIFMGIESVTAGVKEVQTEVIKMTDAVREVSFGVDRVVNEVDRVSAGVTQVVSEVSKVAENVDSVATGVKEVQKEVAKVTDGVNLLIEKIEKHE